MREILVKGRESSYATLPVITLPYMIIILVLTFVMMFSMTICAITFIVSTSIYFFVVFAGRFTIVITEKKISVQKYFWFILTDIVQFDRADKENIDENSSIFEFLVNSDNDKIRLYRHVPSFDIDDEPWFSIESNNKRISIRTFSEKKSIQFFNEIKQAILLTKK